MVARKSARKAGTEGSVRRATKRRIGLENMGQIPVAEFEHGQWVVWLSYSRDDPSLGTYMRLGKLGDAQLVTVEPTGIERVVQIAPPLKR